MIRAEVARREGRRREKRHRVLLTIGRQRWHLTLREAANLAESLVRATYEVAAIATAEEDQDDEEGEE